MEFLPLERYARKKVTKKGAKRGRAREEDASKARKREKVQDEEEEEEVIEEEPVREERLKPVKVTENDDDDEEVEDAKGKEDAENLNEPEESQKNRLLIHMKKKRITNPMEVKELHPDITNIILPRKKRSKWCWAVFESQENASKAFKKLKLNKEMIVRRPYTKAQRKAVREKKLLKVQKKKSTKQKLLDSWL